MPQKKEIKDLNKATDEDYIDMLLEEADSYGLRYEVETSANYFLKEDSTLSKIEAYVMAYQEWLK